MDKRCNRYLEEFKRCRGKVDAIDPTIQAHLIECEACKLQATILQLAAAPPTRCPDRESLTQYVSGEVSRHEQFDLSLHLAECATCRDLVRSLRDAAQN